MQTIFPIPAFEDNYIWTIRSGSYAIVVDPGDAAPVIKYLDNNKLKLIAILVTHHHHDHIGGINDLVDFVVQRVIDQVGLDIGIAPRWDGAPG